MTNKKNISQNIWIRGKKHRKSCFGNQKIRQIPIKLKQRKYRGLKNNSEIYIK